MKNLSIVAGVISVALSILGSILAFSPGSGAVFGLVITFSGLFISWFLMFRHSLFAYLNNTLLAFNVLISNSISGYFAYHDADIALRISLYGFTAVMFIVTYWVYRHDKKLHPEI